MKFPTMDEFAQMVADKAIDEIEYNGKTLRQWIEIILATDINVATKDGTNLAEVGTDVISRADAIKIVQNRCKRLTTGCVLAVTEIRNLPPIKPDNGSRKIGEWIYDWGDWDFETCKCSECGNHMTAPIGKRYSFCPNCGAEMEAPE